MNSPFFRHPCQDRSIFIATKKQSTTTSPSVNMPKAAVHHPNPSPSVVAANTRRTRCSTSRINCRPNNSRQTKIGTNLDLRASSRVVSTLYTASNSNGSNQRQGLGGQSSQRRHVPQVLHVCSYGQRLGTRAVLVYQVCLRAGASPSTYHGTLLP